jgi:tetratricopeptide (TPR) repeat protein
MLPLVKEWRAKDPSLQYRYARLLLRVGDPLGAIVEFRAILKTQQDHQMAYLGLGDSHKHLGMQARFGGDNDATKRHFAEAERAYQKALFWARRKSEGTAVILTHLGWLHIDQERWNEARNFFRTARDEEPGYFGNYWGLGRAEKGLGRTTEAIKAFETALQLAPQNTDAQTIAEITKGVSRPRLFIKSTFADMIDDYGVAGGCDNWSAECG